MRWLGHEKCLVKVALLNQIQHEILGLIMQPFCRTFHFACRVQRLVVQRDSDGDVRRASSRPSAACRTSYAGLALLAVNEPGRRFVRIEQIVVCPLGGRPAPLQGTALIGQDILLPRCRRRPAAGAGCLHPPAFSAARRACFGDTEVFWNSLKRRTRAEHRGRSAATTSRR